MKTGDWDGPLERRGLKAVKTAVVPGRKGWRVQYLVKLIRAKKELVTVCEAVEEIKELIESSCTS